MISFQPTAEEVEFTQLASKLAEDLREKARDIEQDSSALEEVVSEIENIGFNNMEEPEACGGMQMPMLSQVQIYAALAYGDLGAVQSFPGLADSASLFRVLKDKEIPEQVLQSIQKDGCTVAFVDATSVGHEALTVRQNNAAYIVNGTTDPVRLGNVATHVLIAATDETGEVVLLWMERQFNEWTTTRGTYYLGLQEAHLASLSFEQQSVLDSQVVARGEEAETLLAQMQARVYVLQAAKQQGIMQAAVDYATEHTATRQAFGQTIAKFQGVSFRVSQMVIETNVVRNLILQAASAIDEGESEAYSFALSAIHRAHTGVKYVTDSAVQLLGGHGFVQEYPVEKWMRDAQANVLLYGSEHRFLNKRGEQLISKVKTEVQV